MTTASKLPKWLALVIVVPMLTACVESRQPNYSSPERARSDWDRPRPDWNRPPPGRPDRPHKPEQGGFCTREYRPVCGQRGPQVQTFSNACEAQNSGFRVVSPSECRR